MDLGTWLDPEFVDLPALLTHLRFSTESLPAIREEFASLPKTPLSDAVERIDHTVPGSRDRPRLTVRVRRPHGVAEPLPCLYGVHGLGYVVGGRELGDAPADVWCPRLRCVAVSVEQRLAPECPYPGPLEDCYAGLKWTYEHATELGIDPARIGVNGGGAGGGLAAGLCLVARDRGEVPVRFQLLFYPMLDDRQITLSSQRMVPIWNPDANAFAWKSYLGRLYGTDRIPAYAAASRAANLIGLPPTYLMVGALDGLCDEVIDYAQRLNQSGVPTELHVYPGAPHAFLGLKPTAWVSKHAHRHLLGWLERQLWAAADGPSSV
jgi:triacylglycerol lipase